MNKNYKRYVAMMATALTLTTGVVPYTPSIVAYAAEVSTQVENELTQGVYLVPVKLMQASNPEKASMAAACIEEYGKLIVDSQGTMQLEITLKTLSAYGLYGNASNISVYSSFDQYASSSLIAATVLSTRTANSGSQSALTQVTVPHRVSVSLPYTNQDGVYVSMYVDMMKADTAAYLKIDYNNAVDISSLTTLISRGDQVVEANYTQESYQIFSQALKAAKEYLSQTSITEQEVASYTKTLESGIQGLILKDGTYTVPVRIYQASKNTTSMLNTGLNQSATVVVKNGQIVMGLSFHAVAHYGFTGYVSSIATLSNITWNDKQLPSTYTSTPATVLSTHDVVDEYNKPDSIIQETAGTKYPKDVKVTLASFDEYNWMNVFVPSMAAFGQGNQTVRLYTDYAAATAVVNEVAPTIALNKTTATIYTSGTKTVQLKATVVGASSSVTYKSSNTKVATVSSTGKVTAKSAGSATITATANGVSKTCKIIVKKASIKLNKSSVTIYTAGTKTVQLKATIVGASKTVKYKSSNTKVATVSSTGKVTAKAAGSVTITVTANGVSTTCRVRVAKPTLKVNKSKVTVKVGKSVTVKATATPAKTITYASNRKSVATVSSKGVIKAKKKGNATITVSCNGVKKTIQVTVR